MKVTALAFSALGLAGLTTAQNGNDPLILHNRTGLAPVVYDTFLTSYTTSNELIRNGVSVLATSSPVRSNTFTKPTTSVECWRNGYPCGQNGGQRSQRRVMNFVRATAALDARVPPSEFFSTRTHVHFPGEIDVPDKTTEASVGILPVPTEITDDKHYDAPPQPGKTGEAIFSILPVSSTSSTERTAIPTEWWRGPEGAATPTYTIDCNRHYCPSGQAAVIVPTLSPIVTPPVVEPTGTRTTSSHFAIPPPVTSLAVEAAVPIDWWRGPGQPVLPDAPEGLVGPIQRHSSFSAQGSGKFVSTAVVPTPTTMLHRPMRRVLTA